MTLIIYTLCAGITCSDHRLPLYDASVMACLIGGQAELAARVPEGQTVAGWRCEAEGRE